MLLTYQQSRWYNATKSKNLSDIECYLRDPLNIVAIKSPDNPGRSDNSSTIISGTILKQGYHKTIFKILVKFWSFTRKTQTVFRTDIARDINSIIIYLN